jgi:hypothetical protein
LVLALADRFCGSALAERRCAAVPFAAVARPRL